MAYLNSGHHRDWENNGYLKIPGFSIPKKWMLYRHGSPKSRHGNQHLTSGSITTNQRQKEHDSLRSENFVPYHTNMKAIVTTGKVLDVVSELMTEPAVLYKEKINYKYPGGGGYAAHQDAPAYEFVNFHITCLISVDPATSESGCLYFAPGMHQEGFIALDEKGCVFS